MFRYSLNLKIEPKLAENIGDK